MVIPRCFRWVTFLVSSDALRHSRVWGSALCLSIYAVYDEYHKAKTWKRHPYSPHLPRTDFTISPTDDRPQLHEEALLLRGQIQDMMIKKELIIQRTRASAQWELMKEWLEKNGDP
ncbi:hypothetical protein HID58_079889 [Brassica napus]|uniref:Uncharacterized protein n=1 Tax=Brassica napus TaxID=3708 RepID=A0ABQ7Y5T4_BRANA|nr:hypothetical protein HID58_079889 [Brassica napus]